MERLPTRLYTAQQVKQGEQLAAQQAGVEMYTLMQRAGKAVYQRIRYQYPNIKHLSILCGCGNNGGDGFVVAKLAQKDGLDVQLYLYGDEAKISGDAKKAKQAWLNGGGEISSIDSFNAGDADLIVDGLLGTGLSCDVREPMQVIIGKINEANLPVVSIDIPSGLCSDTGSILGAAISANSTVTFIGVKQGLMTGQARSVVGELHFAGLGVDEEFTQLASHSALSLGSESVKHLLPKRCPTAHKGNHGRLLCIGGNEGYSGAIRLCASAAARTGAGLIRTLCHQSSTLALQVGCPEVMTRSWNGNSELLSEALQATDVLALGPGLGTDNWAKTLFLACKSSTKAKVLDADALNLLANEPSADHARVITPHPGEAARLLGCSVATVEQNRFQAVKDLQNKYGGVVVLKGAGTLINDGHDIYICNAGNPGMATGGMGDVLTGIIAAMLAQGLSLSDAAKVGTLIHSVAADELVQQYGQIGLLASDVIPASRAAIQHCLSLGE
ncbi:sugar kinase [Vibrio orientalis CIP 102891 = ATCC 33934]|uniref:Bifunctional NAD(P)H-hydrate repair enzyme n=1 Tax=Vibrio orientalis CIP 102891 = ATCC 33934 TaxID=675816 RepID=C9QGH7_VIBOR|nr:bifunctional ADP-dependent NAD(P)H-hydrate dehydratase/NAD(P)H-hydrate epimerase [Vibrio orientalis]EEX93753.1 YjeF protein [Vibrio orientalis CIP 102891 = ATCC 33934]EGU50761.1 sugar kinase [Vibrio orientalis CIP 102891 = ATCC 33934]